MIQSQHFGYAGANGHEQRVQSVRSAQLGKRSLRVAHQHQGFVAPVIGCSEIRREYYGTVQRGRGSLPVPVVMKQDIAQRCMGFTSARIDFARSQGSPPVA